MTITRSIFRERNGTFAMDNMPPQIRSVPTGVVMDFTRHLTPNYVTATRASNATWLDAGGTLRTAGNDVARFDFNPTTLQPRGLLIEGARTNSLRNSAFVAGSITNTDLVQTTAGISGSFVTSGTTNGLNWVDIRYSGTASANSGIALRFELNATPIVAASGETWTSSTYVALVAGSVSGTVLNISVEGITSPSTRVENSGTNIRSSLTSSLQRFSHTRTLNNAATNRVNGFLEFGFSNGEVVDFTLRIAATQLELGSFASSWIPTTGAAATRALDSAINSVLANIGFNPNEGTLLVEYELRSLSSTSTPLFTFSDGTSNNRLQAFVTSSGNIAGRVVTAGVAANPTDSASPITAGTINKTAFAYGVGSNQAISCTNGTLSGAGSPISLPATATYTSGLQIGGQPAGIGITDQSVWIRRITYYPNRLPNAQLQALTA